MAFGENARANVIAAVAGLIVTFVRNIVQYHRYSWDSIEGFLGTWFVHYIAIVLCAAIACAVVKSDTSSRLGASESVRKMTFEDAVIFAALFMIVVSVVMFLGAHAQSEDE